MILSKEYERMRAVDYAKRWALERNPLFIDFTGRGGDCTNFVSQALLAGSCVMDYMQPFGWYYISTEDRAPAWSGVEFLYNYLTGVGGYPPRESRVGPYGSEVRYSSVSEGDVVQLANAEGDFYHTLIITGFDRGTPLVSAHSDDALDRPLSTYNYASLRYIRIEGVNVDVPDMLCYDDLINGISLPMSM